MDTFNVTLSCNICGLPSGGALTLPTKFWDQATGNNLATGKHWSADVIDSRCTSCETLYGNFAEMVQDIEKITGDVVAAETLVKQLRKRTKVDTEIDKIKKAIEKAHPVKDVPKDQSTTTL